MPGEARGLGRIDVIEDTICLDRRVERAVDDALQPRRNRTAMTFNGTSATLDRPAPARVDWVDYAKGICIIMVVMMHSTLGVEKVAGELSWLNGFIDWARPFRMPDFFLISGLFLAARIDRPWRNFLDGKVLHFAYFYLLWMTIQLLVKGPSVQGWLMGLVEPFGTLWFIYMLALFCMTAHALLEQQPRKTHFAAIRRAAADLDLHRVAFGGQTVAHLFSERFELFGIQALVVEVEILAEARVVVDQPQTCASEKNQLPSMLRAIDQPKHTVL